MAAKTRAFLLAMVLLTAGLAGCADTDETDTDDRDTTGDRDTGDRDTGDRDTRDTEDRDTEDRDTRDAQQTGEMFNRSFNDTIDEQNYQRNWTVPANESNANVTIEANISGDAVDDFEATLWTPQGEEVCTVSASGETTTIGTGDDGENQCEEQLEDTGDHQLTVWGNATAGEAEYWINVTVERGGDNQTGGGNETGGGIDGDTSNGGPYEGSIARMLAT